jgi:fatty-acyl-CoA synthase
VDAEGYLQLADRTRDLVKSGGEWISSVDIECHLMAHPSVQEAAVIAVPHARWQERPVACVVLRANAPAVTEDELRSFLSDRVARWWLPDRFEFIDEVPKTSVGKFDKKVLRERFKELLAQSS